MAGPFGPRPFKGSPFVSVGPQDRRLPFLRGSTFALTNTLVETWPLTTLNAAIWRLDTSRAGFPTNGQMVLAGDGSLVCKNATVTAFDNDVNVKTLTKYDLTNNAIAFQSPVMSSIASGTFEAGIMLTPARDDASNPFGFDTIFFSVERDPAVTQGNGTFNLYSTVESAGSFPFGNVAAFNPVSDFWMRVGHDRAGGFVYWDTAPDNGGVPGTWVSKGTFATSSFRFPVRELQVIFYYSVTNNVPAVNGATATFHKINPALSQAISSSADPATFSFTSPNNNDSAGVNSSADPATYAFTPPDSADVVGFNSNANPATFTVTTATTQDTAALSSNAVPATFNVVAAASLDAVAVTSGASPATFTYTPPATADTRNIGSNANPATFAATANAPVDLAAVTANAFPAVYGYTPPAAVSSVTLGNLNQSAAAPATFSYTAQPATSSVAITSLASPATYAYSAADATDLIGRFSNALPATFAYAAVAATDVIARNSIASAATFGFTPVATADNFNITAQAAPATYAMAAFAATSTYKAGNFSTALPAVYSYTAASTTDVRTINSVAQPASFVMVPAPTTEINTGIDAKQVFPTPVVAPPLSDADFLAWLKNPDARRVVLAETQCIDDDGNTQLFYFGSRGFVTKAEDGTNGRYYEAYMRGGLDFAQSIAVDVNDSGNESYGDIELDNSDASLDWMFDNNWNYQPIRAYVGDATWPRRDFRKIFDGAVVDIDSSARDVVNVKLQDKLFRLDMPIHEMKIGGASPDADRLLPVAFGECHNVTPVLRDATKLEYVYHAGIAEGPFEVRDNGVPIKRQLGTGSPSTFTLLAQPFGRITASIQGDSIPAGKGTVKVGPSEGYFDTVPMNIINLVQNWGTESGKRFTDDDIDWDSMGNFLANNVQPVGIYATDRTTVREACDALAASVGARITETASGLMQLVKVNIPPIGTPIDVGESDMVFGSLHIAARLTLAPSVKLNYCHNWTVQTDTAAGLPEEHKAMFAREWFSASAINQEVRLKYNLWAEPIPENSLLLVKEDAGNEAVRRLFLSTYQRHVYEFTGFADLIFTPVGAAMRLTHHRFGLDKGKTGQVISVSVNWLTAEVTIQVVI